MERRALTLELVEGRYAVCRLGPSDPVPGWAEDGPFVSVTRTDAEWRKLLTPEQYNVMRHHGTEAPGSCALNYEKRSGTFTCAGCAVPSWMTLELSCGGCSFGMQ